MNDDAAGQGGGGRAAASGRIYVVDTVQPRPGLMDAYRRAYLAEYAPGARARGMTLETVRVSPAPDDAACGTIEFTWSVPDLAGWWAMRFAGEADKARWWTRSAELATSRSRRFLVDAA